MLIEPNGKAVDGWHAAEIGIRCGPFNGHYTGQFLAGELGKFGKEVGYVSENEKCTATLKPMENWLELSLTSDGKGKVRVAGTARSALGAKTRLQFEFEINDSDLADAARALVAAEKQ